MFFVLSVRSAQNHFLHRVDLQLQSRHVQVTRLRWLVFSAQVILFVSCQAAMTRAYPRWTPDTNVFIKIVNCGITLELQTKVHEDFASTEKAPTRAFSWLKAAFTFKTLLRHYAKTGIDPTVSQHAIGSATQLS